MEERINQGYLIIDTIEIGDMEFVLGKHIKEKDMYVTWRCRDKKDYFWGHYMTDPLAAKRDLHERVVETLREQELENREKQQRNRIQDRQVR